MSDSKTNKDNNFDSFGKLSRLMQGRYHAMYPRYKERTLDFLAHISRGKNSYDEVVPKSDAVNNSTGTIREYNRSITTAVVPGVALDATAVSALICNARSRYGYERFKGNIHKQCVDELAKLFVLREQLASGTNGKNHKVYVPVFALLAE